MCVCVCKNKRDSYILSLCGWWGLCMYACTLKLIIWCAKSNDTDVCHHVYDDSGKYCQAPWESPISVYCVPSAHCLWGTLAPSKRPWGPAVSQWWGQCRFKHHCRTNILHHSQYVLIDRCPVSAQSPASSFYLHRRSQQCHRPPPAEQSLQSRVGLSLLLLRAGTLWFKAPRRVQSVQYFPRDLIVTYFLLEEMVLFTSFTALSWWNENLLEDNCTFYI